MRLSTIIALLILLLAGCNSPAGNKIRVSEFADAIELEGTAVEFDSIAGIEGAVSVIGDKYLFFLYESDNMLVETDSDFSPLSYRFHIGQGPNEVAVISGQYGFITGDSAISVFDPHKLCIVSSSLDEPVEYSTLDLDRRIKKYSPRSVIRLDNGKYIAIKGMSLYGLIEFLNNGDSVKEWPLGLDFLNSDRVNDKVTTGRDMSYNRTNHLIGEIYAALPFVILHDEEGDIIRIIQTADFQGIETVTDETEDAIRAICLTDDYIWALCPDTDNPAKNHLLVIGYDGTGIADIIIDEAYSFDIDEANRKVIAVNPNDEITVKTYPLPPRLLK